MTDRPQPPAIGALQRRPAHIPEDAVIPAPLDFGNTPGEWAKRRQGLLERWMRFLGPFPRRCELAPALLEEEELPGFTRRRLRYRLEALRDGIWAEACLLVPRPAPSRGPAVLVYHQTTDETIREPVGLAGPASLHSALHLVERGYVVLCPRNYIWDYHGLSLPEDEGGKLDHDEPVRKLMSDHPDWTGMGRMVWDGIRAVDFLQTLDEVDPDRIGCFGFSLGGKEALFSAALDDRIRAAVSMEGGLGLSYSNWHAPWYLGPRIRAPGFAMDNHEVLALAAPRAFLLAGSGGGISADDGTCAAGADGERSWPYVEAVLPLYDMLGARDRLGILCHAHGHSVPAVAREAAYGWLDRFLCRDCLTQSTMNMEGTTAIQ